jgi:hypothetical protein
VIRGLRQSTSGQVGLELFWADALTKSVTAAAVRPAIETQKRFRIFGSLRNLDPRYFTCSSHGLK